MIELQTVTPITIYTIGYRQTNAAEQIENLVAQGYHLVDIRQRAGSRYKPAYNLRQLCQRFGMIYHRLRELGNKARHVVCKISFDDAERYRDLPLDLARELAAALGGEPTVAPGPACTWQKLSVAVPLVQK